MSCITRFAPSPTGDLHLGSVRTALYCWLFAKKHRGKMILRIEDTDLARSTQAAVKIILNGLNWLGLDWDDGPYFQSQRFARYTEVAEQLLENNLAYRCDCTIERLNGLKQQQINEQKKPKYDGYCRSRKITNAHNLPYVVRFKNPLDGYTEFNDLIRGKIKIANAELDDLILIRSDFSPTYNFTVVVDDLDMKITHVIRGEDHISNTPKQLNLFSAIGGTAPHYAHIPIILGPDGAKLSKRHGATGILEYEKMGILPHALINYLVRLGWSHKNQEIFSLQELIDLFDLNGVHKSGAIFNLDKLLWLNHHYIATSDAKNLLPVFQKILLQQLDSLHIVHNLNDINKLISIINLQQKRVKTLQEMATESIYFYDENLAVNINLFPKLLAQIKNQQHVHLIDIIKSLIDALKNLISWEQASISAILKSIVQQYNLKFSDLAVPVRILTTGKENSPPIDQVLSLLGKKLVLQRINEGLEQLILTCSRQ